MAPKKDKGGGKKDKPKKGGGKKGGKKKKSCGRRCCKVFCCCFCCFIFVVALMVGFAVSLIYNTHDELVPIIGFSKRRPVPYCGRNFGVKALMTQYTTTAMDEETCEFFFVQERVLYRIDFNSLGLQEKVIGDLPENEAEYNIVLVPGGRQILFAGYNNTICQVGYYGEDPFCKARSDSGDFCTGNEKVTMLGVSRWDINVKQTVWYVCETMIYHITYIQTSEEEEERGGIKWLSNPVAKNVWAEGTSHCLSQSWETQGRIDLFCLSTYAGTFNIVRKNPAMYLMHTNWVFQPAHQRCILRNDPSRDNYKAITFLDGKIASITCLRGLTWASNGETVYEHMFRNGIGEQFNENDHEVKWVKRFDTEKRPTFTFLDPFLFSKYARHNMDLLDTYTLRQYNDPSKSVEPTFVDT